MKFLTLKKAVFLYFLIFLAGVFTLESCVSQQAPIEQPPLPDEMKHIEIVYGWDKTRDLEQNCKSLHMAKVSRSADWWAPHRKAYELKANVIQFVFACDYECEARFWACSGKSAGKSMDNFGDLVGSINEIKGSEIIVTGKNIGEKGLMGTVFVVDAGEKTVTVEVTFPMMTLVKCRIKDGSLKDVKTGMKVYTKPKKK